ncbi:HAL/PAL/TAL family ammonia-lyase [Pseudoalteromonas luteoviolacea]|uniref:tyrosine ammonia-lyase n=1 Tax=Pseudoalteromonas luteoviolacea NCIMB 1942 TaxID=1365253 RepID=A0A167DAU7_9GAMM|nr:aromatic amino acid ammonia-lyase [Pseudoalteromonas luteoviolacea]KZN48620.1 histidine ammonia-lyase [Pseudoalteromonas luteoviolacea NCIMB 1942]KZX00691.1 histidine ammonia-lyase [Pseudoalteromonas luteoviolacea]
MSKSTITFGNNKLTIKNIVDIAQDKTTVALSGDEHFAEKIDSAVAFLESLLDEEGVIYGVTTGYGDSVTVDIPLNLVNELPLHLTRFHGCGLGEYFDEQQGKAILAARLASLSQGFSGVDWPMLKLLREFINQDIIPRIPQEGSVGASGDLTPLSYIAGALVGERDVYYKGEVKNSKAVMQELGLKPISLRPKEGLAIMNGTAVMTALACLAHDRAAYLSGLATRVTSLASIALQGNTHHFDEILFSVKPHQGQQKVAARIRSDLRHVEHPRNSPRLQDRYSIRCAPHVIGVLEDSLPFFETTIENELNSANDNPIIDGVGQHVLHGGHFYGGHIAMVMDSLKTAVANLADLADRQLASLVDTRYNNGLPSNLSGSCEERKYINHGFKAVQIGASAYTAEALKLTMPASVFSRSTECHNQDKVSMGTISARDALRVLQLTEQVVASTLLAAVQGVRLRIAQGQLTRDDLEESVGKMFDDIDASFPLLVEDRPLEQTLRETIASIQGQKWKLYEK